MRQKTWYAVVLLAVMSMLLCGCEERAANNDSAIVIAESAEAESPEARPDQAADGQEETAEYQMPEPEEATARDTSDSDWGNEAGMIEITIPARYADVRYRIGEVAQNLDNSVTYRLTEEEHEQLLKEVHREIQRTLDEMCASPYFPNFDSITANDDCTVFTVICVTIETSKAEQKSLSQVYDLGKMYAAYRGVETGNIRFVTREFDGDLPAD